VPQNNMFLGCCLPNSVGDGTSAKKMTMPHPKRAADVTRNAYWNRKVHCVTETAVLCYKILQFIIFTCITFP